MSSIREQLGIELPEVEKRELAFAHFEIRNTTDGETPEFVGYASVFDRKSTPIAEGGKVFAEEVKRGAFKELLGQNPDVVLNVGHSNDPTRILARTTSGTLNLAEDQRGLQVRARFPEAQWASDLATSIKRGDIASMSFAFRVAPGGEAWDQGDKVLQRTIYRVGQLGDVSIVTKPAYPDANIVSLRSNTVDVADLWRDATNSDSAAEEITEGDDSLDPVDVTAETNDTQDDRSDAQEPVSESERASEEATTEQASSAEEVVLGASVRKARLRLQEQSMR